MNQTERKAFNWLLAQGYQESDIIEQKRKTPDFITKSGAGFEVKLIYGKTIWFHHEQFELLQSQNDTTILVFDKVKTEPVMTIPAKELKEGKVFNNIKIVVASLKTCIELPEDLIIKVRKYNQAHANRPINVSGVCRIAIEQELEAAAQEL